MNIININALTFDINTHQYGEIVSMVTIRDYVLIATAYGRVFTFRIDDTL